MPLTDEQKTALTAILPDLEPGDLPGYVPQATLTSRLKDKDTKRKVAETTAGEALAALQADHDAATAKLKTFEDADKTAEQIRDRDLVEADKRFEAQKKLTEAATARGDDLYKAKAATFVRDSVTALIAASGVAAIQPLTAVREAMAENQFSVQDTDGTFSLQMTANGLPVDKPADSFGAWWKTRTDLHAKSGTELPAPGAGTPPGDPPAADPLKGLTDAQVLAKGFAEFG